MSLRFAAAVSAALVLAASAPAALAQAGYPNKPIRLIVAFPAGGSTDIIGRLVGQRLSQSLGQQVIIDNRGGAGGTIGTEIAAKSNPDGYTLTMGTTSTHVIAPAAYTNLKYDPIKDFMPITLVATTPYLLVLNPSVKANSLKDFIALAKRTPGKLTYASSGTGGPAHLSGELFTTLAGVKMIHVPYKGSSPGTTSVIAGETDAMFSNLVPALPAIRGGRLRALGVTSARGSSILPDVPPIAASLPGFDVEQLYGLLAPAGTPRDIVRRLNSETAKAVQGADVKSKLLADGSEVFVSTPEEFEKRIVAEIAKWSKVIKAAGIREE